MVEKTNSKHKNVTRGLGSECHRLQVKCRSCCMNAQHVLLIIKPTICIQIEKLQFFLFWGGGVPDTLTTVHCLGHWVWGVGIIIIFNKQLCSN